MLRDLGKADQGYSLVSESAFLLERGRPGIPDGLPRDLPPKVSWIVSYAGLLGPILPLAPRILPWMAIPGLIDIDLAGCGAAG